MMVWTGFGWLEILLKDKLLMITVVNRSIPKKKEQGIAWQVAKSQLTSRDNISFSRHSKE
jgi:hypothetical protein